MGNISMDDDKKQQMRKGTLGNLESFLQIRMEKLDMDGARARPQCILHKSSSREWDGVRNSIFHYAEEERVSEGPIQLPFRTLHCSDCGINLPICLSAR